MFAGPDYPYSDLLQFGVMQEGARDITEVIITNTANNLFIPYCAGLRVGELA